MNQNRLTIPPLQHYKAIIESSNDAIIGKNLAGVIMSWNPAAEKLYGFSVNEAIGQHITLLFPPSRNKEYQKIMDKISNEEKIDNFETVRVTKEGKYINVSLSISPIKNQSGKIIGASTIASDSTGIIKNMLAKDLLIKAGKVLASSLDYEKTLKNVAKLSVPKIADWCSIDILDQNNQIKRLTVAHVNPEKVKWAKELQKKYPIATNEKTGVPEVIRTGRTEFYPEITEELLLNADLDEEQIKLIKKVGMNSVIIAPLTSRGETFGAISFVASTRGKYFGEVDRDLAEELARRAGTAIDNAKLFGEITTHNLELEQKVQQRTQELSHAIAELKRSNQELEDFARVASHDLQEPLRKIHTFGNLLQSRYGHQIDDQSQEYLERIISATKRMRNLIEGLLTYSQASTKQQDFKYVHLTKIIKEALKDLEVVIENSHGEVAVDKMPKIEADPLQMSQVFQNLIGNSLKFHRPGIPPQIRIYSKAAGDNKTAVQIIVEDNGIGIKANHLDRIFTVFERLHTKTEFAGMGIGLAVVQKIIERHCGEIVVTSKPKKGTKFIITLPKHQTKKEVEAIAQRLAIN